MQNLVRLLKRLRTTIERIGGGGHDGEDLFGEVALACIKNVTYTIGHILWSKGGSFVLPRTCVPSRSSESDCASTRHSHPVTVPRWLPTKPLRTNTKRLVRQSTPPPSGAFPTLIATSSMNILAKENDWWRLPRN